MSCVTGINNYYHDYVSLLLVRCDDSDVFILLHAHRLKAHFSIDLGPQVRKIFYILKMPTV